MVVVRVGWSVVVVLFAFGVVGVCCRDIVGIAGGITWMGGRR